MPRKIFINYRREDSSASSGRLYDHLENEFGSEQIFIDVDSITAGADFIKVLNDQLSQCDVMLSVIGPNWLSVKDNISDQPRLENPNDFVRVEIEAALSRDILIIPILVENANMPRSEMLPETLKPFSQRNAVKLTHERFRNDSAGLIKILKKILKEIEEKQFKAQQLKQQLIKEQTYQDHKEKNTYLDNGHQKTSIFNDKYIKFNNASFIQKHQSSIVQGIYLCFEYHKELQEALANNDTHKAKQSISKLQIASARYFKNAWKTTVQHLQDHFYKTRHNKFQYRPRICLKGTAPSSDGTVIIDIFRGESASRSNSRYHVKDNSALDFVKNNATFYICNNIPEKLCTGTYKNPRINDNDDNLYAYCNKNILSNFLSKNREVCVDWGKLWIDYNPIAFADFYRSTLVIPLTLVNNDLDQEFIESTIIGLSRNYERIIYGFLCFDHPSIGYFNDEDISVGHICADLLSFHLINRQALIDDSEIVNRSLNNFKNK